MAKASRLLGSLALVGTLASCTNFPVIGLRCEITAAKLVKMANSGTLMEIKSDIYGLPEFMSKPILDEHLNCLKDKVYDFSNGRYLGLKTKEGHFKLLYLSNESRKI